MVLSAASFATPISKSGVYPRDAHGSSLAQTRILTEKTSPSVSERVAQRIKDRNSKPVHLCICKKARRGERCLPRGTGGEAGPSQPAPQGREKSRGWVPCSGAATLLRGRVPRSAAVARSGLVPRRLSPHGRAPAALYAPGAAQRLPRLPRTRPPAAAPRGWSLRNPARALGSGEPRAAARNSNTATLPCPGTGGRAGTAAAHHLCHGRGLHITAQRLSQTGTAHHFCHVQGLHIAAQTFSLPCLRVLQEDQSPRVWGQR